MLAAGWGVFLARLAALSAKSFPRALVRDSSLVPCALRESALALTILSWSALTHLTSSRCAEDFLVSSTSAACAFPLFCHGLRTLFHALTTPRQSDHTCVGPVAQEAKPASAAYSAVCGDWTCVAGTVPMTV